jgi:hypothetical protein
MSLWDVLVSIFWFMLLVAWFWLMVVILTDIFRDSGLSGGAKAAWCLFIIVLPWLGVLTYLIARGRSMNERAADHAARQEESFRKYVQQTAAGSQSGVADELRKLSDMKADGTISPEDYERAKSKVLGGTAAVTVPQPRSEPISQPENAAPTS